MTEFVTFFLREHSYLVCFYAFLHVSGVEKNLKKFSQKRFKCQAEEKDRAETAYSAHDEIR